MPVMTVPTSITTEAFLELVHRHLTPIMEAQGYVFCGGGDGRATAGPMLLTRSPRRGSASRLRERLRLRRPRLEQVVSAGYEGEDGDERWVSYYPERHLLDLSHFQAGGTGEVATRQELEDRLQRTATHVAEHGLDT
jgi:hypothetical protein